MNDYKADITIKELLEAGAHFGHHIGRVNPKMEKYIHQERNEVHIIDLMQTAEMLNEACRAVRVVVAGGGEILFVGTREQTKEALKEEAVRCGMPYADEYTDGFIKNMSRLPEMLFIANTTNDRDAVSEARTLNIPITAILDTNCDPDDADYPIPGNDDAVRSVKLIAEKIAQAVIDK